MYCVPRLRFGLLPRRNGSGISGVMAPVALTCATGKLRLHGPNPSRALTPPLSYGAIAMCRCKSSLHYRRPSGNSLLEVMVAGVLAAVALVPALKLMREGMGISREIETEELLTTFCVSKLEEHLAGASADWQTGTYDGDFSAEGYSRLRFSVQRSDAAGDSGITDQLMSVTALVWEDVDSSGTFDEGERSVVFASKASQLPDYLAEAEA